jgi:HSP20 family protein
MHDWMDRMLEQDTWRADLFAIGRGFPIDVFEEELRYIVEASMPGIKPEDLKVTATNAAITIRAITMSDEQEGKEGKEGDEKDKKAKAYVRRERYSGEVTRVIDLPDLINPDKIKASYKHGVLTLEVPKAEEIKPRKVDIAIAE